MSILPSEDQKPKSGSQAIHEDKPTKPEEPAEAINPALVDDIQSKALTSETQKADSLSLEAQGAELFDSCSSKPASPSVGVKIEAQEPSVADKEGDVPEEQSSTAVLGTELEKKDNPSQVPEPPKFVTPKPATWTTNAPSEPWCPAGFENELGFKFAYEDDFAVSEGTLKEWELLAATKRGKMHAHQGTHREDAFHWRKGGNFAIYCVCDGAGSSKLSRVGSEFTSRHLCETVADELLLHEQAISTCSPESLAGNLRGVLNHGVGVVAVKLSDLALKMNFAPKDFRCTLLTVLHYQHPSGSIFICGNVGDGFIAIKRKNHQAERVTASDSGNFSGEVLCFMPDSQVGEFYKLSLEKSGSFKEDDVEAVILCTDGIEDPFFPIHRTIPDIYLQLSDGFKKPIKEVCYSNEAQPGSVLRSDDPINEISKWINFEKRGENDDRTIMIVHRSKLPLSDSDQPILSQP